MPTHEWNESTQESLAVRSNSRVCFRERMKGKEEKGGRNTLLWKVKNSRRIRCRHFRISGVFACIRTDQYRNNQEYCFLLSLPLIAIDLTISVKSGCFIKVMIQKIHWCIRSKVYICCFYMRKSKSIPSILQGLLFNDLKWQWRILNGILCMFVLVHALISLSLHNVLAEIHGLKSSCMNSIFCNLSHNCKIILPPKSVCF